MKIQNKRIIRLLELFIKNNNIMTSEYIASNIGVTSRTIRKDIKELNSIIKEYNAEIISEKGKGYLFRCDDLEILKDSLEINCQSDYLTSIIPTEPDDRVYYIFSKLLKNTLVKSENIDFDSLADELFISTSTLKKDLKIINDQISKFNLKLRITQKNGIYIIGEEKNIRYCISEFMFKEISIDVMESKFYSDIFSKDEVEKIKEILLDVIVNNNIRLTDVAFRNVLCHILIMLKRHNQKRKNYFDEEEENTLINNSKEFNCAKEIIRRIETNFGIDLEDEVYYLAQHIISSNKFIIDETEDTSQYKEATRYLLIKIKEESGVDFLDDKELLTSLAVHLKVAVMRLRLNMNIRNEFVEYMKSAYPFAFEIAILAGKYIEEMYDIKTKESEIGFLAMHFGAALVRKGIDNNVKSKKVVIVCPTGTATALLLKERIKKKFKDKINVVKICASYELNQRIIDESDFILTTIPINHFNSDKIKEINLFLTNEDISNIQSMIDGKNQNMEAFEHIFEEDLFFKNINLNSKEEIIEYISEKMIQKGYINNEIKESIYEREKMATTELGNFVAMPHPLLNNMSETKVSILILDKAIIWNKEKVQVILLISVPKNEHELWETVFKTLYYYLIENNGVQKLMKGITYNQFIFELKNMANILTIKQ